MVINSRCAVRYVSSRSAAGHLLQLFRVPSSLHRDLGGGAVNLTEVVRRKFDCHSSYVFVQAMQLGGAWNWNDPRFLGEQPRERDLSGRRLLPLANPSEQLDQDLICLERLRKDWPAEEGDRKS